MAALTPDEQNAVLRAWSASLPLRVNAEGIVEVVKMARPWNGRRLSVDERVECLMAYCRGGAQAAYEWLSEYAP